MSYSPVLSVSDDPTKSPDERFFSDSPSGGGGGPASLIVAGITEAAYTASPDYLKQLSGPPRPGPTPGGTTAR